MRDTNRMRTDGRVACGGQGRENIEGRAYWGEWRVVAREMKFEVVRRRGRHDMLRSLVEELQENNC